MLLAESSADFKWMPRIPIVKLKGGEFFFVIVMRRLEVSVAGIVEVPVIFLRPVELKKHGVDAKATVGLVRIEHGVDARDGVLSKVEETAGDEFPIKSDFELTGVGGVQIWAFTEEIGERFRNVFGEAFFMNLEEFIEFFAELERAYFKGEITIAVPSASLGF